jgi:putative sterol carrier protein
MTLKAKTPKEVLEGIRERLTPERLTNVNAIFALELPSGHWTLDARPNGLGITEGKAEALGLKPDLHLSMGEETLLKLARRELRPELALMTGKMKLHGNMLYATKLRELLSD